MIKKESWGQVSYHLPKYVKHHINKYAKNFIFQFPPLSRVTRPFTFVNCSDVYVQHCNHNPSSHIYSLRSLNSHANLCPRYLDHTFFSFTFAHHFSFGYHFIPIVSFYTKREARHNKILHEFRNNKKKNTIEWYLETNHWFVPKRGKEHAKQAQPLAWLFLSNNEWKGPIHT